MQLPSRRGDPPPRAPPHRRDPGPAGRPATSPPTSARASAVRPPDRRPVRRRSAGVGGQHPRRVPVRPAGSRLMMREAARRHAVVEVLLDARPALLRRAVHERARRRPRRGSPPGRALRSPAAQASHMPCSSSAATRATGGTRRRPAR